MFKKKRGNTMSKKCIVCENICADSDQACPICGSYELIQVFQPAEPVSNQQAAPVQQTTPVQQTIPAQQQAAYPNQPNVQGQAPYPNQPYAQGQAPYPNQPYVQGQVPYPNQPVFYHMPYQAGQTEPNLAEQPPKKKSHKVLFIILGSVGGLLIVGIITGVLLLNHFRQTPSTPSGISGKYPSHHRVENSNEEYYYPDYTQADHSSESFVTGQSTTENPAAADSTEDAEISSESTDTTEQTAGIDEGIGAFTENDLFLFSRTNDIQIPIDADHTYQILNDSLCRILPYSEDALIEDLDPDKGYGSFETGRGIAIGTSADEFIEKYGTDTTNALWIMLNGAYSSTYYYSTISKPDFGDEHTLLTIGWSIDGTQIRRLTPEGLNDIIFNYDTTGSDTRYLIYYADINADYQIQSMHIVYGNPMVIPDLTEQ